MEIIPVVLDEDVIEHVPLSILRDLANCSSKYVLKQVDNYLNSSEADPDIQKKIYRCFKSRFQGSNVNVDEDLIAMAEDLEDLDNSTIVFEADEEYLVKVRDSIKAIIGNPDISAYITPMDNVQIKDIITTVGALAKGSNNAEAKSKLKRLHGRLKMANSLFKDPPNKGYESTPYRRVLSNDADFKIIGMGIDHILEMKRFGVKPETWRYL